MANTREHLAVAYRNGLLINHLLTIVNHSEWLAIVSFYKALHLVDAMLFCDNIIKHASSHAERHDIIKRTRKYKHIAEHYLPLHNISLIARYLESGGTAVGSFSQYMSFDKVVAQVVNHRLKQLESSVSKIIDSHLGTSFTSQILYPQQ